MEEISFAGRKWNEDTCFSCENFWFVIDGATSLVQDKYSNLETDAKWYSNAFGNYLKKALPDSDKSIADIIKEGIHIVVDEYKKMAKGREIVDMPSACIAIVRKVADKLEYFVLGDSGFLFKHGGSVKEYTQTRLAELDQININDMARIAKEKHIDVVDTRKYVLGDILKKRLTKNTENGYWVLCDDVRACDHAYQGELSLSKGDELLIYSDGFSEIWTLFNLRNKMQIFKELEQGKHLTDLYNMLYVAQEEDAGCNKFPRTKIRDDATAIYVKF